MKARFIAMSVLLVMLAAASEAPAAHVNPLVAPAAPWTAHLREMDRALAAKNLKTAERAWEDAFVAAVASGLWQGMVEVGDASLRMRSVAGLRSVFHATARRSYVVALLLARQAASLEGVLRTAEAFAALGDREAVDQCLRIADGVASEAGTVQALERVQAVRAHLTAATRGNRRW